MCGRLLRQPTGACLLGIPTGERLADNERAIELRANERPVGRDRPSTEVCSAGANIDQHPHVPVCKAHVTHASKGIADRDNGSARERRSLEGPAIAE